MDEKSDGDVLNGLDPHELLELGMESGAATPSLKNWSSPTPEELDIFFDDFEVTRLIGAGGMGTVYEANQISLDRKVAIKLLPLECSEFPEFVERFQREARLTARLEHPDIVRVYETGQTSDGHAYIVMEYVDGTDLESILQEKPDIEDILRLIPPLCRALEYAHAQGVVHRDLKPANILISRTNDLKVADFGLAKLIDGDGDSDLTRSDVGMGTPYYAAPEQTGGVGEADHRADIYSLGVMVYRMVTGNIPRGTWEPPSRSAGVDVRMDELVSKAMAHAKEQRFQNVSEIREGVEAIISSPYRRLIMRTLRPGLRMMDVLWGICGVVMFFLMLSAHLKAQTPTTGSFFHVFEKRQGPLDGIYIMLHFFCPIFYTLMGVWILTRWRVCIDYELTDRFPTPLGFLAETGSREFRWVASLWVFFIYLLPVSTMVHFFRKLMKYSMGQRWESATVVNRYTGDKVSWWAWDSRIFTEEANLYALGQHTGGVAQGPTFWPVISPIVMTGTLLVGVGLALIFILKIVHAIMTERRSAKLTSL